MESSKEVAADLIGFRYTSTRPKPSGYGDGQGSNYYKGCGIGGYDTGNGYGNGIGQSNGNGYVTGGYCDGNITGHGDGNGTGNAYGDLRVWMVSYGSS
jgi:hypothetical protein